MAGTRLEVSWQNLIWEGAGELGELLAHSVGEAMDHEWGPGPALLWLLHVLWLLPLSWTAAQGMTALPLCCSPAGLEAWEPPRALAESPRFASGGKCCRVGSLADWGKATMGGWQCQGT